MVCPYNRKNQTSIIQWKQEYNEDGQAYFLTQISKDSFELMSHKASCISMRRKRITPTALPLMKKMGF